MRVDPLNEKAEKLIQQKKDAIEKQKRELKHLKRYQRREESEEDPGGDVIIGQPGGEEDEMGREELLRRHEEIETERRLQAIEISKIS